MLTNYSTEIEDLKTNIIKMASLVDEMVEDAFSAIEKDNTENSDSIKARDIQVDKYDNLIKEKCESIFALYQPVASDLRFLITTLMVNNQLERCGDIAVNISRRIKKLGGHKELFIESKLIDMGRQARLMVKEAIDSFINKDAQLARGIGEKDKIVDTYNKSIFKFVVDKMNSNNILIEPSAHLLILSKHIERLADHATNIAEEVIFLIDAEIVAHKKKLRELE
jgi:phosphate transport system protein